MNPSSIAIARYAGSPHFGRHSQNLHDLVWMVDYYAPLLGLYDAPDREWVYVNGDVRSEKVASLAQTVERVENDPSCKVHKLISMLWRHWFHRDVGAGLRFAHMQALREKGPHTLLGGLQERVESMGFDWVYPDLSHAGRRSPAGSHFFRWQGSQGNTSLMLNHNGTGKVDASIMRAGSVVHHVHLSDANETLKTQDLEDAANLYWLFQIMSRKRPPTHGASHILAHLRDTFYGANDNTLKEAMLYAMRLMHARANDEFVESVKRVFSEQSKQTHWVSTSPMSVTGIRLGPAPKLVEGWTPKDFRWTDTQTFKSSAGCITSFREKQTDDG